MKLIRPLLAAAVAVSVVLLVAHRQATRPVELRSASRHPLPDMDEIEMAARGVWR